MYEVASFLSPVQATTLHLSSFIGQTFSTIFLTVCPGTEAPSSLPSPDAMMAAEKVAQNTV